MIAGLLAAAWIGVAALPAPDQIRRDFTEPRKTVAGPSVIIGPVRVIDGDTIRIGPATVRLEGIDAPEGGQECFRSDGAYDCGATATQALDRLLPHDNAVCVVTGKDKYRRLLGECWASDANRVAGQPSVNADMVRQGHAIAYRFFSLAYVAQEDEARQALRGMWAGKFQEPWEWRKDRRAHEVAKQ